MKENAPLRHGAEIQTTALCPQRLKTVFINVVLHAQAIDKHR